jgi:hypothetical protein
VLPEQPVPELIYAHQRRTALESFTNAERTEVGLEMYQMELDKTRRDMEGALGQLRGDTQYPMDVIRNIDLIFVAKPYRGLIKVLPKPGLNTILRELYNFAYPHHPPEFFTQYRASTQGPNQLRNTVRTVVPALFGNQSAFFQHLTRGTPVALDLVTKFLQRSWGLLSADYRIQQPTDGSMRRAWQLLDTVFQPDSREVLLKEGLLPLFNPPYGYDFNTALLLFGAWFGYNAHDLQVSLAGKRIPPQKLADLLERGSRDFFNQTLALQPVALQRRDPGKARREVDEILQRLNTASVTQEEANRALDLLREYLSKEGNAEDLRERAFKAAEHLETALAAAITYDKEVTGLLSQIEKSTSTAPLIEILKRLRNVSRTSLVRPTAPSLEEVQQKANRQLHSAVDAHSRRFANPNSLSQVEWYRQNLVEEKNRLRSAGFSSLLEMIDSALQALQASEVRLRVAEQESQIRNQITAIRTDGTLEALHQHQDFLQSITDLSEQTEVLRAKKLASVQQEIIELEQQVEAWRNRLAAESRGKDLLALKETVLRSIHRYQNSRLAHQIDEILSRCNKLYEFVNALEGFRRAPLTRPDDYLQAKSRIAELHEQYNLLLTDRQRELIHGTVQDLENKFATHQQQALDWLGKVKHEYRNGGSPATILMSLKNVPAFLPEADLDEVKEIYRQVQQRIAREVITRIELQFREIRDRAQQRECLQRLQTIFAEEELVRGNQ